MDNNFRKDFEDALEKVRPYFIEMGITDESEMRSILTSFSQPSSSDVSEMMKELLEGAK